MQVWFQFAARNLLRQKKRSIMLGGAIAFCVLIMTVMTTLTQGMTASLHTNFSQTFGGHVYVTGIEVSEQRSERSIIRDTASLEAALTEIDEAVAQANKRSSIRASLVFGSRTSDLSIQGVDYQAESALLDSLNPVAGDLHRAANRGQLILPSDQAEELGVSVGETVLVKGRTLSGQQNLAEWVVGAVIESSKGFGQAQGYMALTEVNTLLNIAPQAYQSLNLFLHDLEQMDAVAEQLKQALAKRASVHIDEAEEDPLMAMIGQMMGRSATVEEPWEGTRFDVTTLEDRLGNLLSLVTGLSAASSGVFALMLVITLVGINNAFRMVIVERTQEIGTLRAIGAQRRSVKALLLWEAVGIALVGGVIGLAAALLALLGIGQLTLTTPPLDLFTLNHHPVVTPDPAALGLILVSVIAMSLLAAFLPARAAARLSPAEALRSAA